MKKCPNCGAQNADDSRFCTECGKEFPQGNVCPHCGASVNEGDAFCQNCGKKLSDNKVSVETAPKEEYTNEDVKTKSAKNYLPYILSLCVAALLLGGAWWWKSSGSKVADEEGVPDSTSVVEISQEDQIREQLQLICDTAIGVPEETIIEKYFSSEFKKLYSESIRLDKKVWDENGGLGFWDFDFWYGGQDGSLKKMEVKQININSETSATADVLYTISFDSDNVQDAKKIETFSLLFENGKWVIDDLRNYKKDLQEYIKSSKESNNAEIVAPIDSVVTE